MKYYSTNGQAPMADLRKAVVKGLAEDRGLYMPERLPALPRSFFDNIQDMTFQEVAFEVANAFFGEDIPADDLRRIVNDTLSFDCPVKQVEKDIWTLELFHGPTLAFKDVGGRFMARLLQYFNKESVNVLVATSGDTGSAVANGFLGVEGINVYVLYPKGKVSPIQECQFTTLGRNISAIEIDGVFDDCQALVKKAFVDQDLRSKFRLSSANSINIGRLVPQVAYYVYSYIKLVERGVLKNGEPMMAGSQIISVSDSSVEALNTSCPLEKTIMDQSSSVLCHTGIVVSVNPANTPLPSRRFMLVPVMMTLNRK